MTAVHTALLAHVYMSLGHSSDGPDFDTDLSRNVSLLRLIASNRFGEFDLALKGRFPALSVLSDPVAEAIECALAVEQSEAAMLSG